MKNINIRYESQSDFSNLSFAGLWIVSFTPLPKMMLRRILMLLSPLAVLAQNLGVTPVLNFTQILNHGSNDSTTFQQAYQVNATYFKSGGPILLYQFAETPKNLSANHGTLGNNFIDYAKDLGAMVITLEHRFFGTSFPAGFEGKKKDFAPLTLDNIVQDAVTFIEYIKKTVPGAATSKVIVNGGMIQ